MGVTYVRTHVQVTLETFTGLRAYDIKRDDPTLVRIIIIIHFVIVRYR